MRTQKIDQMCKKYATLQQQHGLHDGFFFCPILEHFCPLFAQIAQMGSLFAQMGSLFAQISTPNPCSLLRRHTPLSGICTYIKRPPPHPKTPLFKNRPPPVPPRPAPPGPAQPRPRQLRVSAVWARQLTCCCVNAAAYVWRQCCCIDVA